MQVHFASDSVDSSNKLPQPVNALMHSQYLSKFLQELPHSHAETTELCMVKNQERLELGKTLMRNLTKRPKLSLVTC